jgi:hypothetical protein
VPPCPLLDQHHLVHRLIFTFGVPAVTLVLFHYIVSTLVHYIVGNIVHRLVSPCTFRAWGFHYPSSTHPRLVVVFACAPTSPLRFFHCIDFSSQTGLRLASVTFVETPYLSSTHPDWSLSSALCLFHCIDKILVRRLVFGVVSFTSP